MFQYTFAIEKRTFSAEKCSEIGIDLEQATGEKKDLLETTAIGMVLHH